MADNNAIIDNSERTHKTNIKMKRRLSFHHTSTTNNNSNTLEHALNEYGEHSVPNLDNYNITNTEQPQQQQQQTLNDSLVLSYLDTDNFNYNSILTNLLLNKNRSKTETLSMFTTIIDQLDDKIKKENKNLNQELSDSILQNIISQISTLIKDNKEFSNEFERIDKKLQSLTAFINNKKHQHQSNNSNISSSNSFSSGSRNASKRLSSINSANGQRVTSMIGGMSSQQTPRLLSNNSSSSSPDLWDNYNNGMRINSASSLDIVDKSLLEMYDLYLQRKQFDRLYELVLENRNEKSLVLKYETIIKNKIINELSNNSNDALLLKKYLGQLKQLDSDLNLSDLFFTNRKNTLYNSIINDTLNDITKILLTLEYVYQVIKLHQEIFVSQRQNIDLIKFVQEILTNEFLNNNSRKTTINNDRKYEDLIKSYFEKYEDEYKLNFFYILDDFKNSNVISETNGNGSADNSFDITAENSYDLTGEDALL